mgnify:CR=1 FL=1
MNYIDGKLEIDASVPDVFSRDKVSYYFLLDDVRQDVVFNEGYSLQSILVYLLISVLRFMHPFH